MDTKYLGGGAGFCGKFCNPEEKVQVSKLLAEYSSKNDEELTAILEKSASENKDLPFKVVALQELYALESGQLAGFRDEMEKKMKEWKRKPEEPKTMVEEGKRISV